MGGYYKFFLAKEFVVYCLKFKVYNNPRDHLAGVVVLWRVRGEAQGVLLEEDHLMRFGFRTLLCGADKVYTAYRRQGDECLAFAELTAHDEQSGRRVNLELTL